jgi:hypothetical protein
MHWETGTQLGRLLLEQQNALPFSPILNPHPRYPSVQARLTGGLESLWGEENTDERAILH